MVQAEAFLMMQSYGYRQDELPHGLDGRDEKNSDHWIPRNPRMNRLTGIHPFNSEAPLSELRDHGFITPPRLHIVRRRNEPVVAEFITPPRLHIVRNHGKA